MAVRDERGKRHRGLVSLTGRAPSQSPKEPAEFQVALLTSPVAVQSVPGATAICIPHLARGAAVVDAASGLPSIAQEIAALKRGEMSEARHAQYRAGEVRLPAGTVDAAKVFAPGGRVDLEHLALVLVDMRRSELLAPFYAIIRHELGMPPTANALLALETRLYPADPDERPPARAPGIARLRRALKRLEAGDTPAMTLDELTADLRFLRLFERTEHILRRTALDRLLSDVSAPTPEPPARSSARIIKLRPRGDA
jgi:hypothetical protein